LTTSTAREGQKYNILVNAVAPNAGTNMTRTVRPEAEIEIMKPDYVAPLVALLCSDRNPTPPGKLYESGCGHFANTRWQRARGVDFDFDAGIPSVEAVYKVRALWASVYYLLTTRQEFGRICDFDNGLADNPESPADGGKYSQGNIAKSKKLGAKL
jgi:multifunctional beta-oxidation protein